MRRRIRVMCGMACGLIAIASAQVGSAQVTLLHKFREGSQFTVETTAKIEQKLTIAGSEIDTSSDSRSVSKATVGTRDVEGNLSVKTKVESLNATVTIMGQTYQFDSANPDNKGSSPLEILRDVHKAVLRSTTTSTYDKANRVTSVKTDEDLLGALSPEAQLLAKSQLDPGRLKDAANEELDQIKQDPVKPGDTWQRTTTTNFGGGQVMDFKKEFTYQGPVEKNGKMLDKITFKTLSVTFALENSPLPFSLKSSDLKPAESEGTILFDREAGEAVEANSSVRITGDILFVLNNTELPSKLDLKIQNASLVKQ